MPRTFPASHLGAPSWWSRSLPVIERLFDRLVSDRFPDNAQDIFRARDLARQSHSGKVREGGGDYLIHPLRVAISTIEELSVIDPVLVKAAVLHDTIEDSDCDKEGLEAEFGDAVAQIVSNLSRRPDEKRPARGDSLESSYIQRILNSGMLGMVLKAADKLDNLRDALYHPNAKKRRVFVDEVQRVYVPLISSLHDPGLCERLEKLLRLAAESHSLSSLIGMLEKEAERTVQGECAVVPPACLDAPLTHYLLFNPCLAIWLADDGIQLIKTTNSPRTIAANVAREYLRRTDGDCSEELLTFAGIPSELASVRNETLWTRARLQWRALIHIIEEDGSLQWGSPIFALESARWLLLLIHSILFRPASWVFPIWHSDYGMLTASESPNSPYANQGFETNAQSEFHSFLQFLLTGREALWRLASGTGTVARAESVFEAAKRCPAVPKETLWSLRLLSEYLDVVSRPVAVDRTIADFGRVWKAFCDESYGQDRLSRIQGLLLEPEDELSVLSGDIEISGLVDIRDLFASADRSKEFAVLLSLLIERCQSFEGSSRWLSFEVGEFLKRREFFSCSREMGLNGDSSFQDIEAAGIRSRLESFEGGFILKVYPAKRFALQNRLPELSDDDLHRIGAAGYSATSIFDTLILEHMGGPEPVWIPRVYRILDTIEDLDHENAQRIEIVFRGVDHLAPFTTCLPLPSQEEPMKTLQDWRKEILARYLVAQIYNIGITRRVLSAHIECAGIDASRITSGFTNETLITMLDEAERKFGFRGWYGHFIESFNFSPFRITGESVLDGDFSFGEPDLRSGLFLGIDIGGTDIKFQVFKDGKAAEQRTLGKTKTFPKGREAVDISDFFKRLISDVSSWLDSQKIWPQIAGIGLSWAGPVRDNRIACFSKTLQVLHYQGRSLDWESPAGMIHSLPFVDLFAKELDDFARSKGFDLEPNLTLIVENDGNAEAFGNYCSRVLAGRNKPGGKLILKLGTSLAGARILPDSSVAGDVAEFAKIVLKLNVSEANYPHGSARDFVSSLGVRNLSRTFEFRGRPLFGPRGVENSEEARSTRIEAIELGELLDLVPAGLDVGPFLQHLIHTDNQPDNGICDEVIEILQNRLRRDLTVSSGGQCGQELINYIDARGGEWPSRYLFDASKSKQTATDPALRWKRGCARLYWLCASRPHEYIGIEYAQMPNDFPADELAEKIIGTFAIFSQLSLYIAHTVAALYNIYRRDSFNEVILAGGVLSGATGELVKTQTEGFLLKYYDKLYGSGKSLPRDAIQLADSENREAMGPLGAAMLANRSHKGTRLKAMHRLVDFLVDSLAPGKSLRLTDVESALHSQKIRADLVEVRDYLYIKVAESLLIPQGEGETFTRCVKASS